MTGVQTCALPISYIPDAGFSGTDSFQFVASRGNQQSEAGTITLSVHSLLAAADPANVPDPDQGKLVTPDLDGGPLTPPDTGPAVIPDGDGGKAVSFDPKDLPGPDEPVITGPTKDQQQSARTSSVDLQSLSSGFLPSTDRHEPSAVDAPGPPLDVDISPPATTDAGPAGLGQTADVNRSEEHTSELQSHSFISYAVFCLKKKKNKHTTTHIHTKKKQST